MAQLTQTSEIDETDDLPFHRRIWTVVSISFALCMLVLDINIIDVVLPTLPYDFGTSPAVTTWIINRYQLAVVISLLSFSSLDEMYGYRKIPLPGIAMFIVTSLICALSHSSRTLTLARIFQGFNASATTSVNTAQLRTIYPRNQVGRGMGVNAMVVAISAAAGPSAASSILSIVSWHWLSAISVSLGLAALILGCKYLPRKEECSNRKLDKLSAIADAITFGLLIYILDGFAHHERNDYIVVQLAVLTIVGTYCVCRQLNQSSPLLPLDLLGISIFRLSILTSICSFAAQMLVMVSLPFFLQNSLRYSEVMTGLLLTPWPTATLVIAPAAEYLVERIHPGILGSIGIALFCIGLYSLPALTANSSVTSIILRLVLCGAGFGIFQTPNSSIITSSAPTQRSGGASGMLDMTWLLGQTFGTTLVALLFSFVVHEKSTAVCLMAGSGSAFVAAVVSSMRLS